MASDVVWAQSELAPSEIEAWREAGALDAVRIMDLVEAGWTPDMAQLMVTHLGQRGTIARAVSRGMSLDEAERLLARSRRPWVGGDRGAGDGNLAATDVTLPPPAQ